MHLSVSFFAQTYIVCDVMFLHRGFGDWLSIFSAPSWIWRQLWDSRSTDDPGGCRSSVNQDQIGSVCPTSGVSLGAAPRSLLWPIDSLLWWRSSSGDTALTLSKIQPKGCCSTCRLIIHGKGCRWVSFELTYNWTQHAVVTRLFRCCNTCLMDSLYVAVLEHKLSVVIIAD